MVDVRRRWVGLLAVCAAISGCGGDAFVSDGGGTGGSGGSAAGNGGSGGSAAGNGGNAGSAGDGGTANGGSGGSSSSGGAGNAGSGAGGNAGSGAGGTGGGVQCPDERPSGACDTPGLECHYGDPSCCQDLFTCENGSWGESICPGVSCPLAPPAHGSECGCLYGKQCTYDCSESTVATDATCTPNGTWSLQSRPCPGPCGNVTCMLGQICITKMKGTTLETQYCTPTTCSGELTCQCASTLCGPGYSCTGVANLGLICAAN